MITLKDLDNSIAKTEYEKNIPPQIGTLLAEEEAKKAGQQTSQQSSQSIPQPNQNQYLNNIPTALGPLPNKEPKQILGEYFNPETIKRAINSAMGVKLMAPVSGLENLSQSLLKQKIYPSMAETAGIPQFLKQGIQQLPQAAQSGLNYLGNVGKSALLGAAQTEHPMQDLPKSAGIAAVLEGIIPGTKGIGMLAEQMRPIAASTKLGREIIQKSEEAGRAVGRFLNPIWKKFGGDTIYNKKALRQFNKTVENEEPYFSRDAKIAIKEFQKNPTINNANIARRIMGEEMGTLDKSLQSERNAFSAYKSIRDMLKNRMHEHIQSKNPSMAKDFLTGTDLYRATGAQFKNDPFMKLLLKGHMDEIEPRELINVLKRMQKRGALEPGLTPQRLKALGVPGEHFLKGALKDLQATQLKGDVLKHIMSYLTGGALGSFAGPLGAAGGAITGGVAQHFLAPSILRTLQNKKLQEQLAKMIEPGRKVGRAIIPALGSGIG